MPTRYVTLDDASGQLGAVLEISVSGIPNIPASKITSGEFDTARFPDSGVSAGSYTFADITVDAKGRVTAASNGTLGDSPRSFGWGITGSPGAGAVDVPQYTAATAMTLTSINLVAGTAPTGSAFDVDVERWNGSAWASVFSTRPTIAAGQTTGGGSAVFSTTAITAGWRLRINIIAVNGAANITIQLNATAALV